MNTYPQSSPTPEESLQLFRLPEDDPRLLTYEDRSVKCVSRDLTYSHLHPADARKNVHSCVDLDTLEEKKESGVKE